MKYFKNIYDQIIISSNAISDIFLQNLLFRRRFKLSRAQKFKFLVSIGRKIFSAVSLYSDF